MKKILVVDDDPMVIKAISSQFDRETAEVLPAADGLEGLAMAQQEKPDLILLDLMMPKMDGLEMLAELRQTHWGKTADVVILSNFSDDEKIAVAFEYGVKDYLVKVNWNVADVGSFIKKRLGI